MTIPDNVRRLTNEIAPVQIIGVTKYATDAQTQAVIDAGISLLGESRVKDAEQKINHFTTPGLHWHMIGHLQTNKVKKAVALFDCIQSADSLKLLQKIDDSAREQSKMMPVLLQVNVGKEPQKSGFLEDDLLAQIEPVFSLSNLKIDGIMVIAPDTKDEKMLRDCFQKARAIFKKLKPYSPSFQTLSMGMSQDYRLAIEEGATMVRIGSLLFQEESTT